MITYKAITVEVTLEINDDEVIGYIDPVCQATDALLDSNSHASLPEQLASGIKVHDVRITKGLVDADGVAIN